MAAAAIMMGAAAEAQTLTEVIVPQFIEGVQPTNNNRTPYVYRVTLSGLTPSATYRYFNQVVIASDAATSNGAGNVIFVNQSGAFFETSGPALTTVGTNCNTFTTDGTGSYTGWFMTEPTGNAARFTPGGQVLFRINLNDGASGTTVVTRLTTTSSATVLDYGATATNGTGIESVSSPFTAKDFVFLYDNATGTGRPISGAVVEADGWDVPLANTNYAAFYRNNVDEVATAWGTILPNTLANGIQYIESRSLSTGAIVSSYTDSDGLWPSGVNTVNPASGLTQLSLVNPTDYPAASVSDWTLLND